MFEAYVATEIASKLNKSIEVTSLAADNSARKVFLGSKAGHLLSLTAHRAGRRYEIAMCRSFEKRAVTDLRIIFQHGLILCLSDSQLSAHDIDEPFGLKASITEIKPITSVCTYISEEDELLYVIVAARKKYFLYKWLANDFLDIQLDLSPPYFPDNAQHMVWCGPIVALAVMNEYYFFSILPFSTDTIEVKKLFGVGSRTGEPLIVDFREEKLIGYCRDEYLVFQDYNGDPSSTPNFRFSEMPLEIVYDAPYVIALFSKGRIEIRSLRPPMHIQTLQLSRALHLANAIPGTIYVGSNGDVWLLDSHLNAKENVKRLVREKHFELAIQLAEKCIEIGKDDLMEIKRRAAFNFFCQKRFDEWLELHTELKTDVMTVIAHFPRLVDPAYSDKLSSLLDEPPPTFAENDCKDGLLALARYLVAVHYEHDNTIMNLSKQYSKTKVASVAEEISHHKTVLQVVDTTLLKCYLQAEETLVPSLMGLSGNMCILPDSEKILVERGKFYELFLLYEKRNLHREALSLLKEHSHDFDSQLKGCDLTVRYLQRLGNANIDLIFSFAPWVLHENFNAGLSIFTVDDEEVRLLDRDRVLQFLTRECVAAILPYLEHIIYVWGEKRPKFHEALGSHYISRVKQLMKEYISVLKDDESIVRAGEEEGELGEYRRKLLYFLQNSNSYSAEKLLVLLRQDSLYEERAMLLGRLKRHEQALAIYTNVLKDYKAAEDYCSTYYDRNDPENSKVWLVLLRMYTYPPDVSILGLLQKELYQAEPNQIEAIRILKDHASSIDTVEAIQLLPPEFPLKSVWNALEAILQSVLNKKTSIRLHKSVCDAALAWCLNRLIKAQSVSFSVNDSSECAFCGKKIMNR